MPRARQSGVVTARPDAWGLRPLVVPPAGQERQQVADADRDQDHQQRDEEGVEPADVQRPDDDPDAEAGTGGKYKTHGRWMLLRYAAVDVASAAANELTSSRTASTGRAASPATLTNRLPTITPSAPSAIACTACSGVEM